MIWQPVTRLIQPGKLWQPAATLTKAKYNTTAGVHPKLEAGTMSGSGTKKPGFVAKPTGSRALPARSPGPLGRNDRADPNVPALAGDSPGPAGCNDGCEYQRAFTPVPACKLDDATVSRLLGSPRSPVPVAGPRSDWAGYPDEMALFVTWLVRENYIRNVAGILPAAWRAMPEAELTTFLSSKYSEAEIKRQFLAKYAERKAIKQRFRKVNIVAALVIGLVWARENIEEGEWGTAAAKIGGAGFSAFVLNKLLYMRDPAAATIMAKRAGNFGRWFQGAARTNKLVNFLARDVARVLVIWDLKDLLLSGGYGGPNIPFDLIMEIDIDDESTWKEPDQALLNFGFNIWYQQKCTELRPEACGSPLYLGKVEGSAIMGLLRVLDIAPSDVPKLRQNLYRIEGDFDVVDFFIVSYVRRRVEASENVLVIATGRLSGMQVSGRGHFRNLEVIPANEAAVKLFGGKSKRWVPEYLLKSCGL